MDLITQSFPYPSFNLYQKKTIIEIIKAIRAGKKHIIVQAPTGIGKSAIAVTVHKALEKIEDLTTTIVTGTKALQDQYAGEFDMFDIRGRANYTCNVSDGVTFGTSRCKRLVSSGTCVDKNACPYVRVRNNWVRREPFRMTNMSFVISLSPKYVMEQVTNGDSSKHLMIIDECHETPNAIIDHATINLKLDDYPSLIKTYGKKFTQGFSEVLQFFSGIGLGFPLSLKKDDKTFVVARFVSNLRSVLNSISERAESDHTLFYIKEELESLESMMSTIIDNQSSEWVITDLSDEVVSIKPVYANQIANKKLFSKANQFLHISATICDHVEYCDSLGIDLDDVIFIDVPNPIPVESRKVYIYTGMRVNAKTCPKELTAAIDKIISSRKDNTNGVIHTVSFKLANDILKHSKHKKKMIVSNSREEILEHLKSSTGAIVLSPSVETGYDFKGDLARWQIIAKVPYLYIGDLWVKLNMDRSNAWYSRQAIIRLIQASGRVSRGVDDFGETFIVDANAANLLTSFGHIFPDWYVDSIEVL